MRFEILRHRALLGLAALLGLGALPAAAAPVFGPETYARTLGASDTYTDTFASSSAGSFSLWVHNGDDGGNRPVSGSIALNGTVVATDADFRRRHPLFYTRPVTLVAGNNTLTMTLSGDPGSYVTLVILPPGQLPNITFGRLILPWASATNLVLDLKNGSHAGRRSLRVVFYDGAGNPVAASGRLHLDRRAGFSQALPSLINSGAWSEGSIEVFYCGPGPGRLFGQAVTTDATTSISSIVLVQHAGYHRFEP